MVQVSYTPAFLRQFKKLEEILQEEAYEKIILFEENPKNPLLKVHKLKGQLKGRSSFAVNYKVRIVFLHASPKEVILLAIGDHDVYKT